MLQFILTGTSTSIAQSGPASADAAEGAAQLVGAPGDFAALLEAMAPASASSEVDRVLGVELAGPPPQGLRKGQAGAVPAQTVPQARQLPAAAEQPDDPPAGLSTTEIGQATVPEGADPGDVAGSEPALRPLEGAGPGDVSLIAIPAVDPGAQTQGSPRPVEGGDLTPPPFRQIERVSAQDGADVEAPGLGLQVKPEVGGAGVGRLAQARPMPDHPFGRLVSAEARALRNAVGHPEGLTRARGLERAASVALAPRFGDAVPSEDTPAPGEGTFRILRDPWRESLVATESVSADQVIAAVPDEHAIGMPYEGAPLPRHPADLALSGGNPGKGLGQIREAGAPIPSPVAGPEAAFSGQTKVDAARGSTGLAGSGALMPVAAAGVHGAMPARQILAQPGKAEDHAGRIGPETRIRAGLAEEGGADAEVSVARDGDRLVSPASDMIPNRRPASAWAGASGTSVPEVSSGWVAAAAKLANRPAGQPRVMLERDASPGHHRQVPPQRILPAWHSAEIPQTGALPPLPTTPVGQSAGSDEAMARRPEPRLKTETPLRNGLGWAFGLTNPAAIPSEVAAAGRPLGLVSGVPQGFTTEPPGMGLAAPDWTAATGSIATAGPKADQSPPQGRLETPGAKDFEPVPILSLRRLPAEGGLQGLPWASLARQGDPAAAQVAGLRRGQTASSAPIRGDGAGIRDAEPQAWVPPGIGAPPDRPYGRISQPWPFGQAPAVATDTAVAQLKAAPPWPNFVDLLPDQGGRAEPPRPSIGAPQPGQPTLPGTIVTTFSANRHLPESGEALTSDQGKAGPAPAPERGQVAVPVGPWEEDARQGLLRPRGESAPGPTLPAGLEKGGEDRPAITVPAQKPAGPPAWAQAGLADRPIGLGVPAWAQAGRPHRDMAAAAHRVSAPGVDGTDPAAGPGPATAPPAPMPPAVSPLHPTNSRTNGADPAAASVSPIAVQTAVPEKTAVPFASQNRDGSAARASLPGLSDKPSALPHTAAAGQPAPLSGARKKAENPWDQAMPPPAALEVVAHSPAAELFGVRADSVTLPSASVLPTTAPDVTAAPLPPQPIALPTDTAIPPGLAPTPSPVPEMTATPDAAAPLADRWDAAALPRQVPHALMDGARRAEKEERVELVLDPVELGRVRFELSPAGDRLHVTVSVERQETLDLLRRNIDLLRAEFREAGFDAANLSFGQWGAGGDRQAAFVQAPAADLTFAAAPTEDPASTILTRRSTPVAGGLDLRL